MQEIRTEDLQNITFEILKFFHESCEKNNIHYSLAYGTLLGAIRHQGFIPWDDDVDIFMTKAEYEKLKQTFSSEKYEIVDWETDPNYPYLFPKIRKKDTTLIESGISDLNYNIGVYLDIFVLYEVPLGLLSFFKQALLTFRYKIYRLRVLNLEKMSPILKPFAKVVKKFVALKKIIAKTNKVYSKTKGDMLRDISMPKKEMFLKKFEMQELVKVVFRDGSFFANKNYNEVLQRLYGDYMQLPPKEQQMSNHSFFQVQL